jgi:hypothetical protein
MNLGSIPVPVHGFRGSARVARRPSVKSIETVRHLPGSLADDGAKPATIARRLVVISQAPRRGPAFAHCLVISTAQARGHPAQHRHRPTGKGAANVDELKLIVSVVPDAFRSAWESGLAVGRAVAGKVIKYAMNNGA